MNLLSSGEDGFKPPSVADFQLPPIFGDNPFTTKPIFLAFLSVILVSVFFIAASRKALMNLSTDLSETILAKRLLAKSSCALCHTYLHCLPLF